MEVAFLSGPLIVTPLVKSIMMGQPRDSSKVPTRHGTRWGRFCGLRGNVQYFSILSLTLQLLASDITAGSGKSVLWCVTSQRSSWTLLIQEISYSIIKDIQDTCATGLSSVVYHYFDFKDAEKQDRRGFISCILNQLYALSHHGYDTLSCTRTLRARHGVYYSG
jgi:hypothetical protein